MRRENLIVSEARKTTGMPLIGNEDGKQSTRHNKLNLCSMGNMIRNTDTETSRYEVQIQDSAGPSIRGGGPRVRQHAMGKAIVVKHKDDGLKAYAEIIDYLLR